MISKKIALREVCPALGEWDSAATLTVYARDLSPEIDESARYPGMVICPGGAYRETSDREAEPVALALLAQGYNAFVLRYSVAPARYPQALLELFAAIAYLRDRAEEYHLDPKRIVSMGFSAGGHLAACSGIFWSEAELSARIGRAPAEVRPDAMVLGYPVITADPDYANAESFEMLLGKDADLALLDKLSLDRSVSSDTVPAFVWHTVDDNCVPSENSLLLASALKRAKVPFELHLYPTGAHGLSLAPPLTALSLINNSEPTRPY